MIKLTSLLLTLAVTTGLAGQSLPTASFGQPDRTRPWERTGLLSVTSAGLTYVLIQTLLRPSGSRSMRYTEQGLPVATAESTMRSRSSGGSAVVAALVTTYLLSRTRYAESSGTTKTLALLAAAVGVVALRTVAASDLATDLGLGAATAVVVHTIRF